MTKVNDSAPCVSLSVKISIFWADENMGCMTGRECLSFVEMFHIKLWMINVWQRRKCDRTRAHKNRRRLIAFHFQTASNLLPKPGPPGNQHPHDPGTAVGKVFFTWLLHSPKRLQFKSGSGAASRRSGFKLNSSFWDLLFLSMLLLSLNAAHSLVSDSWVSFEMNLEMHQSDPVSLLSR